MSSCPVVWLSLTVNRDLNAKWWTVQTFRSDHESCFLNTAWQPTLRNRNYHQSCTTHDLLWPKVPAGLSSRGGNVTVYVLNTNQSRLPTLYSVLVSVSVFTAVSPVVHSINSPDNSPLSHSGLISALLILSTIYISLCESLPQPWHTIYISLWKSPSALTYYMYLFVKVSHSPDILYISLCKSLP